MSVRKEVLSALATVAGRGVIEVIKSRRLRNYIGYAVIVFDRKSGSISYNSDSNQEDMVKLLRELADCLSQSGEGKKIIIL